ncbi:MAG TPA: type II secretion system minor pseudopilin GspK [Bdellovibrionota bacterium]|nr:type II secretion system minor pseudopilin GspK [Bdellovibrionota bacterium]
MTKLRTRDRRGVALLMVLTAIAIITAVVVEVTYTSQLSATIVTNHRDGQKAVELARAALRWSIFRIQLDNALDQVPAVANTNYGGRKDDLSEVQWAFPISYPFPTAALAAAGSPQEGSAIPTAQNLETPDGSFVTVLSDESGKINLNDVGRGGPPGQQQPSAAMEILENLLLSDRFRIYFKGKDHRTLLWAIEDWIDSDSEINHLGGGIEDAEYQTVNHDHHVKNGPFYSVMEIRELAPMNDKLYRELLPFVTVYPFDARLPRISAAPVTAIGKINVNTAPLEVIAALFNREVFPEQQQRLECAQQVVKYRKNVVFRSIPDLMKFLEQSCGGAPAGQGAPSILSSRVQLYVNVRTDTFSTEATGLAGNVQKTIRAVISRQNPTQPKILYWKVL